MVGRVGALFSLLPLLTLFFGSGCAALIYEIVWFQTLQLFIRFICGVPGDSAGDVHGGLVSGKYRRATVHLEEAASAAGLGFALEFGSGFSVCWFFIGMPYAAQLQVGSWQGLPGMLVRGCWRGLSCCQPPVLNGATMPEAARCVEATGEGVSYLGLFYASNIFGAVFGSLLAGFYLLRLHDMPTATCVAAGINGGHRVLRAGTRAEE